jgi:integrase
MLHKRKTASRSLTKDVSETLTDNQVRLLLEVSAKNQGMQDLHDILRVLLNTGIRPGELKRLRWVDLDAAENLVLIRAQKAESDRSVFCDPATFSILSSRRKRYSDSEFVLGSNPELVFRRAMQHLRTVSAALGIRG